MAKTKTKSKESGIEILEDPEILAGKAEEFFSDKKNRSVVLGVGGLIALAVAGFFGYRYYVNSMDLEAQTELYQAIFNFEKDSLGKALNGDGLNYGFLQIIEDYSGTNAANLSNFYAGTTYLKLGDYDNAIRYLEEFSGNDLILQARCYALIGDANMELNDYSSAVQAYEQAVNYKPTAEFTPVYLQKLAIAAERNGEYSKAASAYGKIISDYKESPLVTESKKHKARLDGLAVNN